MKGSIELSATMNGYESMESTMGEGTWQFTVRNSISMKQSTLLLGTKRRPLLTINCYGTNRNMGQPQRLIRRGLRFPMSFRENGDICGNDPFCDGAS